MADQKSEDKSIKNRYAIAIALVIIFIAAIFGVNVVVFFIITRYFPSLSQYITYVAEISSVLLGILCSYVVYRILVSIANLYGREKGDRSLAEVITLSLRVLFYFVVILIVLTAFGVSPSSVLAGGAIGGVVLGLAVQTILTSILSGVLISSSKTIFPGEILVVQSYSWGNVLCKVHKVGITFTEVISHDGNKLKIPNTALLTSALFVQLRSSAPFYSYPFQVSINADVPLKNFDKKVNTILTKDFSYKDQKMPEIYLLSKASGANTYNVVLYFDKFEDVNKLIGEVNKAFDDAYWSLKKK